MSSNTKLSTATLRQLDPAVQVPAYDRTQLKQHTVHLGVGGFHRAHQAVYLDDLLEMPDTARWGECGLGVLTSDDRMRDALLSQDGLFTVVERSADAAVLGATLAGSVFFYVASNALTWLGSPEYPQTLAGLWQALTVGLPGYLPSYVFFRNELVSDGLYSMVFLACVRLTRPARETDLSPSRVAAGPDRLLSGATPRG